MTKEQIARAAAAIAALCLVGGSACGARPPSAPDPAPPLTAVVEARSIPTTLPGIWRGFLVATDCVGGNQCSGPLTIPFTLRVAASGGGYIGSFEIGADASSPYETVMDVSGNADADGLVVFTGDRGAVGTSTAFVRAERLAVKANSATGLSGDIDLRSGGNNLTARSLKGRVDSASFSAPAGLSFAGNWEGVAVIRSCTGDCGPSRSPGRSERLRLFLSHSGTLVTGLIQMPFDLSNWVSLSGSASGSTASVATDVYRPGGDVLTSFVSAQLNSMTVTLDALGRLSGTMTFSADQNIAIAPFRISYRQEFDILWLTRD